MTGQRRATASNALPRLAYLALLAYCALGSLALIHASARLLPNRWENTYTESPTVYVGAHAASSRHLYHSLSRPPYTVQPYGPLFYGLSAAVAAISGHDIDATARRGRLLVFSCYLLCGLVLFGTARRLGFSRPLSAIAGLLFCGQPALMGWNASVRPDMTSLLLMLASVGCAVRADDPPLRTWAGSGALTGLSFLIKPPGAAAGAAVFLALLRSGRRREASAFTLGAAAPVAIVLGWLWLREPFFAEQVTSPGKVPWSVADAVDFVIGRLGDITFGIPLAIGALGIAAALGANLQARIVAYFAIATAAMGLLTIPQLGGDENYFFPALAGCSLLAPFAVQWVQRRTSSPIVMASIIGVLVCAIPQVIDARRHSRSRHVYAPDDAYAPLRSLRILSDTPFIALRGRDPELLDPYSMHAMELAGSWNAAPIRENVERGDYDLIVLACGREFVCGYRGVAFFSREIVQSMNQNYEVLCADSRALVLTPRSREPAVSAAMLDPILGQPCATDQRGNAPNLVFPAASD